MMIRMKTIPSDAQLIGEGFGSTVYLTSTGQIIRVAKNQLTQEEHQREVAILRVLHRHIQSIAIPDPTIIIEPSREYPFGAIGYDQITGKPLQPEDITPELQSIIAAQIAQFISEMHQAPLDRLRDEIEVPPYLPSDRGYSELWHRMETFVREQSPGILPQIKTAFSKSTINARAAQMPKTLLHADLWYENMIFNGEKLVGIIDFEASSIGNPIVDFMTQGYFGDDFRRAVVEAFQNYGAFEYDEVLGKNLMFLRELRGLDYGIQTHNVDEDSLAKIIAAAEELEAKELPAV
jgi:aminoglycoside phosphotransferase (APT) family kinase protein